MTRPEEENLGRIPRLVQSIKYMLWKAQASAMVFTYVLSLCWLVLTLCCTWQGGNICSRGLLPAMLEKVLFNRIPIKCFINIYYSLVAVFGNTHLPRRAQMKYISNSSWGRGENDLLLFVLLCGVSVVMQVQCVWTVRVLCSKFPVQDLVWSSSGGKAALHVCSAARGGGSSAGTALALSMFHRKQIFPRSSSETANRGHIGQCVTPLVCTQLPAPKPMAELPLPFSCVISQMCWIKNGTWAVRCSWKPSGLDTSSSEWLTACVRLLMHSYNSMATSPGDKWV